MLHVMPNPWAGRVGTPWSPWGEPWGASRDGVEEEHRLDHRGKTLVITVLYLLKRWILGVIWLAEARQAGACPGDLSHSVLPSRDVRRAVGIRCSPSPAQGIWVDGLPARLLAGHSSLFSGRWQPSSKTAMKSNPVLGQAALKPCVSPNLKA